MDNNEIFNNKELLFSLNNEKNEQDEEKDNEEIKEIIFRNYIPQDKNIKVEKCYKTDEVKSIEEKVKANVLKSVKEFLNLEKNNNIIKPVKRDYDLKRNIAQKMNYLNNLTEESLKKLSKKKIEES